MKKSSDGASFKIRKKQYPRIPNDGRGVGGGPGAQSGACPACDVAQGQLHADGCGVEQCPRCCQAPALSCGCAAWTNAQLRPAGRKQVQHLVMLGCDKGWARSLRAGGADQEILSRDPAEAERRRQEQQAREQLRKERRRERFERHNQAKLDAEREARRRAEEWFVDFGEEMRQA